MLWLRAAIFSVLVPGAVALYVPWVIGPQSLASGWWRLGWCLVLAGAAVYLRCLLSFVASQGTPAIFFTRQLRALWGEEPRRLVRSSLYRYSRNPMYGGVIAVILGQALLRASWRIALYGACMFVFFHSIVTLVEEPHLRARDPQGFDTYCRATPRWLGIVAARPGDSRRD
jgi:protein-S-isoprenylcysteine O-methyltransferase Ste14